MSQEASMETTDLPVWPVAYILECADSTLYTGSTNDLNRRIHEHNHSKSAAHYTKIRRPVKIVHSESFDTLSAARKREYEIKQLTRAEKRRLFSEP